MQAANDQLPETEFFRIERASWLDDGRKFFHIQPKREKTSLGKAMLFNLPGAHWNLAAMTEILQSVNDVYAKNRRTLESRNMSETGKEVFELGKFMMGAYQ